MQPGIVSVILTNVPEPRTVDRDLGLLFENMTPLLPALHFFPGCGYGVCMDGCGLTDVLRAILRFALAFNGVMHMMPYLDIPL